MQVFPAKNGSPTLLHGKTWLHSRYNPEAEAKKYIASLEIPRETTHFILIECALGYIIPVLRAKYPDSVIVALHAARETYGLQESFKADFDWYPETPRHIQTALERDIPEDAHIKIVEWRPSLAVYPDEYRLLLKTAADFLKQHTMNQRTAAYFAKRWKKNAEYNTAVFTRRIYPLPRPETRFPIVVAAAGPSLARSLPEIKKKRENVYLIAVTSALAALYEHDIRPDMTVTTDGGFWALPHLFALKRHCAEHYPVIAAALNARLPSFLRDAPLLLISDGGNQQNTLLKARRIPFLVLPQRGTVSATALDLAFFLTGGPVYVAGLDLADQDVISHARPHAFDTILLSRDNRFAPYYHETYARQRPALDKDAQAHAVYASWFKNNLSKYAPRLIALGDNHPLFAALRSETIAETGAKGVPALAVWGEPPHSGAPPVFS
jgi:hypothetical protein